MDEEDSEWEYEYDDTETESFYVTFDISSTESSRRHNLRTPAGHAKGPESTVNSAERGAQIAEPEDDSNGPVARTGEPEANPEKQIQILDLHTINPIVKYQGQIYSCEWTSVIGTELLITKTDSTNPLPTAFSNADFSILSVGNIKLMGQPIQLAAQEEKCDPARDPSARLSTPPGRDLTKAETTPTPTHTPFSEVPSTPNLHVLPKDCAPARQSQADFLNRLRAIKATRGETDEVRMSAKSRVTDSGWRRGETGRTLEEQRKRAREFEKDEEDEEWIEGEEMATPMSLSGLNLGSAHYRGRGGRGRVAASTLLEGMGSRMPRKRGRPRMRSLLNDGTVRGPTPRGRGRRGASKGGSAPRGSTGLGLLGDPSSREMSLGSPTADAATSVPESCSTNVGHGDASANIDPRLIDQNDQAPPASAPDPVPKHTPISIPDKTPRSWAELDPDISIATTELGDDQAMALDTADGRPGEDPTLMQDVEMVDE